MPARDRNGRAVVGRLRVFQDQTNTPVAVYTSSALDVAHSQPVASDDTGRFPILWIDGAGAPVTVAFEQDDGQTATIESVTPSVSAAAAIIEAYSGAVSLTFSASMTDGDPGAGAIRFNNAAVASVTSLYIDNTSGGASIAAYLDSFDDANVGSNRGVVALRSTSDAGDFALFTVSGPVTDGTGYRKVPVAYLSGPGFANGETVVLGFSSAGATGATGATGPAAWQAAAAWQTATAYSASDPKSVVVQGGETYVCAVSHTSGVFATDLGAGKWLKLAAKGADGAGTGDVVGPASAVDGHLALFNTGTGKLLKDGGAITAFGKSLVDDADAAAGRTTLGLGTAATKDTGVSAGNVPVLDGSGRLPAVDGSQLTNLNAGAMVLLSHINFSAAASADVDTYFTSTYDEYIIIGSGITVSVDDTILLLRVNLGLGFLSTNTYKYHVAFSDSSSTIYDGICGEAESRIILTVTIGNASNRSANFTMRIRKTSSTTLAKLFDWTGEAFGSTAIFKAFGVGCNTGTGALTGLRFFPAAGTFSGDLYLYGIKKS
jgi:hypothetical protein